MKRCSRCNELKSLSDFNASSISKDGLSYWCKDCQRKATKKLASEREQNGLCKRCGVKLNNTKWKNCDACRKKNTERSRKYRKLHPKKYDRETYKERKRRDKLIVFKHYGGDPPKCACCGESHIEFLTIDHINNDGAKHRRKLNMTGGIKFYRWLKRNNYPEGYRVLCWNCNCSIGVYGYCPHIKTSKSYNNGIPEKLKYIMSEGLRGDIVVW